MIKIIQIIIGFFAKPNVNHSSNTEWMVNFIYGGKEQMRILQGENENMVRERFMSARPSAKITGIMCLNCG